MPEATVSAATRGLEIVSRACRAYEARPTWVRWGAACAWMALIWWASSRPARGGEPSAWLVYAHNGAHIVLFGTLAVLVRFAWMSARRGAGLAAFVFAVAYGVLDELHQSRVDGRSASAWDVASDTVGAALFLLSLSWATTGRHGVGALVLVPCAFVVVGIASFGLP